ncbi:MAG: response regulator [Sutterella sp.]|nr:response regulator [Sutterella sp.]
MMFDSTPNPDIYPSVVRVIDDEESVRNSEAFTLRVAGIDAITYESAEEFLDKDDLRRPGCIVLEVRMPGMSGLELQQEMQKQGIDLPILFLTGHGDISIAVLTLKRGAEDFCEKPVNPNRLRETARKMIDRNIEERRRRLRVEGMLERWRTLTGREQEVAKLVASDMLNKQIAVHFSIQEHTGKIHRSNARKKLEVRSALELNGFLKDIGLL